MSKIRINDLARELEVKSKEILDVLTTVGVTEKKTQFSRRSRSRTGAETSPRPLRRSAQFGEDFACRARRRRDQDQDRPLAYLAPWRCTARHHAAEGNSRTSCGASGSQNAGCPAGGRSEGRNCGRSSDAAQGSAAEARNRSSCAASTENGDTGIGSGHVPPAVGGRDSAQSSRDTTRRDQTGCLRQYSTACDRRSAAGGYSCRAGRKCSASGAASGK